MAYEEEDTYLLYLEIVKVLDATFFSIFSMVIAFGIGKRQKRPTIEAKETYYRGKRDLL
jgi:hypothetical protein